jgi:hypothetical protein
MTISEEREVGRRQHRPGFAQRRRRGKEGEDLGGGEFRVRPSARGSARGERVFT